MQKFELVSPFKPSGDQPKAIEGLVKGLNAGVKNQVLLGVTGSGKSLTYSMPVYIYEKRVSGFQYSVCEIGELVEKYFTLAESIGVRPFMNGDTEELHLDSIERELYVPSINPNTKSTELKRVYAVTRHAAPKKLWRITTSCGRWAEVTGDHNFFVHDGTSFTLKKTSDVEKGDYIPIPFCFDAFNVQRGIDQIDLTNYIKDKKYFVYLSDPPKSLIEENFGYKKWHRMEKYNEHLNNIQAATIFAQKPSLKVLASIKTRISPRTYPLYYSISDEFLELLGYYISEGHSTDRILLFSLREDFMVKRGSYLCEKLGLPFTHRKIDGDLVVAHEVWSNIIKTMCGASSGEKRLPDFWPNLDKRQLGLLLSSYYSGDGGVEKNVVSTTTKSKKLASDLMYALLKFDIWARLRKKYKYATNTKAKTKRLYYEISISGQDNIARFKSFIGFTLPRKNISLDSLLGKEQNTNVDIIPVGDLLKRIRAKYGFFQKDVASSCEIERSYISMIENGLRRPSRAVSAKIVWAVNQLADCQNDPLFAEMVHLNNSRWAPIASIEEYEHDEEKVYDFSVVDNETFLAGVGGMFVHNTYTISEVIQEVQKPTLILCHNKTLAAQLYSEFKDFFPKNAVDYFVSYYDYYQPEAYVPSSDTYIEKDASINEEIAKFRHAATMHLLTRKDVIIIATVSCIYGLGSVENYEALSITLKKGEQFQRDKLLRRLTDIQYRRSSFEFKQGMFHVLGDVVEIIPPGQDTMIRLEFFGDEIEAISEADSFTGEVIKSMDEVVIFPAKHEVTTNERIQEVVPKIREELDAHVAELRAQGKMLEAERIKTRTEYDLEILVETGYCTGIENYTRFLGLREPGAQSETLFDYFPDDYLLVVDESHITIPQIGGMYNGNFSRKQTLIDFGFRMPSAHDNRPLKFEEFERHMNQTIYVSATPAKYELEHGGKNIVEQIVRPTGLVDPEIEVRPTKGQIQDLADEIKKRIAMGERTLITTLTKRSSEDLTDYLLDANFKVKYLHSDIETLERVEILRDLRLGVIDVVVGINLLREGLDLPEVSLITILDADKQGFLRSAPALIQTIGRAARNVNGRVIMYADKMTDAMKLAISETDRRRAIQVAYNEAHGITPQTIKKAIKDLVAPGGKKKHANRGDDKGDLSQFVEIGGRKISLSKIPKDEIGRLIKNLEDQMEFASANLDFERASELNDQIEEIREEYKV